VNEKRGFLLWQQRLNLRIGQWRDVNRDPGALLFKALLAEARTWREQYREDLSQEQIDFIAANEEQERKDTEQLARLERQAGARRLATESARCLREEPAELERSVLLAIEALRRLPVPEVYDTFMRAFELAPRMIADLRVKAPLADALFSPDGKWIVAASEDGEVVVLESAGYRERFRFEAGGPPGKLVFSPDSKYVGVPEGEHDVVVWDLESGTETARVTHQGTPAPKISGPTVFDTIFMLSGNADRIQPRQRLFRNCAS